MQLTRPSLLSRDRVTIKKAVPKEAEETVGWKSLRAATF